MFNPVGPSRKYVLYTPDIVACMGGIMLGERKKIQRRKLPQRPAFECILRLARNHYPVSCPFVLLIQVIQ